MAGIRRLLLMTCRNRNDRGWDRLRTGPAAGDVDGEIATVWLARELLSEVYAAIDLAHAKRRPLVFLSTLPTRTSPSSPGWPRQSIVCVTRCSPTTRPAVLRTDRPKPST